MLVPACLARAQVAEARGDHDRVVEALAPIVRLAPRDSVDEPGFWPWQEVYANALVLTNRTGEADEFLVPHERLAALRGHRSTLARLGLVRGRITAARGDIDTARKEFEQALHHLDRRPLPYDRARVNFAYGQSLRRAGKRRDAANWPPASATTPPTPEAPRAAIARPRVEYNVRRTIVETCVA